MTELDTAIAEHMAMEHGAAGSGIDTVDVLGGLSGASELNVRYRTHFRQNGSLLNLERVVIRRLILLMGRGEEIDPSFDFPQVESDGNLFMVPVFDCYGAAFGQYPITGLIARDRHQILTRRAKSGEDDGHCHECRRQRY